MEQPTKIILKYIILCVKDIDIFQTINLEIKYEDVDGCVVNLNQHGVFPTKIDDIKVKKIGEGYLCININELPLYYHGIIDKLDHTNIITQNDMDILCIDNVYSDINAQKSNTGQVVIEEILDNVNVDIKEMVIEDQDNIDTAQQTVASVSGTINPDTNGKNQKYDQLDFNDEDKIPDASASASTKKMKLEKGFIKGSIDKPKILKSIPCQKFPKILDNICSAFKTHGKYNSQKMITQFLSLCYFQGAMCILNNIHISNCSDVFFTITNENRKVIKNIYEDIQYKDMCELTDTALNINITLVSNDANLFIMHNANLILNSVRLDSNLKDQMSLVNDKMIKDVKNDSLRFHMINTSLTFGVFYESNKDDIKDYCDNFFKSFIGHSMQRANSTIEKNKKMSDLCKTEYYDDNISSSIIEIYNNTCEISENEIIKEFRDKNTDYLFQIEKQIIW